MPLAAPRWQCKLRVAKNHSASVTASPLVYELERLGIKALYYLSEVLIEARQTGRKPAREIEDFGENGSPYSEDVVVSLLARCVPAGNSTPANWLYFAEYGSQPDFFSV
ncbi:hypothetical protein FIBSPDRAFT_928506 [Athelia psychrophila]|uniref:Uncharacterized protein n=1 Tax=Athelia psychrophila TaxID=1759441 RepID=A0A166Q7T0_9AGAM|nr:hypothetical protein FIBSPDRAFT_928506 [Fibularhizoctonia sp. CBS 109695]